MEFQDKNEINCISLWNNISYFIAQNYSFFHFLTIISFFIKTPKLNPTIYFTKDMKIQDCLEFLK